MKTTTNQIIQNLYNTKYELAYSQVFDKLPGRSNPVTLYRIRALRDIYINDQLVAKTGDYGGWIENEDNLSAAEDANCWIAGYANGEKEHNPHDFCETDYTAKVYGNAKVRDNVYIDYNCFIYGHANITDNAQISHSRCFGHAVIRENAIVSDSYISGRAYIRGNAHIYRSYLSNISIYGNIDLEFCHINKPYNIGSDDDKWRQDIPGLNFRIFYVDSKNYNKTDFDFRNRGWHALYWKDITGNWCGSDDFVQYRVDIEKD